MDPEIEKAFENQPCKCGHKWKEHLAGDDGPCNARLQINEKDCDCMRFEIDDRYRLIKTQHGYLWGY